MKTICYMRVSSKNGRQKTDSQKSALRKYCSAQGVKRPTYIEDHATGRNQERPGFQKMLDQARAGRVRTLIVWKLDRLGRSMIETIRTIQELMTLKVKIIVTTQGLTFDESPYSVFLLQLFAALAELESNHASERIKAGLEATKEKGTKLGRPVDKSTRTKLQKWAEKGIPVTEQAKKLGVTKAAVYNMRRRMQAS